MNVPASSKYSRWLWPGVVAWLLMAAIFLSMTNSSTWANPPDSTPTPQSPAVNIEPFSFQLPRPPEGGMKAVAAGSVQPVAAGDWSQLMSADFEGTFLPLGWEVQGETIWVQSSTQYHGGSYSAGVEGFAGAPSTWLVYGGESGFSLEDVADARLDFWYWLDTDTDAYFGWAASADGVNFYGARTYGRVGAWLSGSLDLKHLVYDDSVWIAFSISGDGSGTGQNIYLDDVAIMVQEPWRTYLPTAFKNYVPPFPDFHDDFSDPSSGWPRVHIEGLPNYEEHRDYSNEYGTTYRMKLGGYTWFHRIFASPEGVGINDDFTIETNIMYDWGDYRAGWGVIFEASDDMQSYYMVGIYRYGGGTGGYYHIRRRTPSEGEVDLAADSIPGYLKRSKGEWSLIRVVREGNGIYFYAYGYGSWELLASVNASPLSGERVGYTIFNSELGADGWFDNFHLWQEPLHP
jgi:hypothetical protein